MSRRYEQHGRRHLPNGSDPIGLGNLASLRIVYGQIDGTGDIVLAGSGDWSIDDYDAAGSTTIIFPPFADTPIIVLTKVDNPDTSSGEVEVSGATAGGFIALTFDSTGTAASMGCNFIAVGT